MVAAALLPVAAHADWWSENFELHGFAKSTAYINSPGLELGNEAHLTSWSNVLNLEWQANVYEGDELTVDLYGVFTPTYDAVYDIYPNVFGKRRDSGDFGTQFSAPVSSGAGTINDAIDGRAFPGHGACIKGQFCDANQDTAFLFTGRNNPQMFIDNTIFFGALGGATRPRGSAQAKLGGHSNLEAFRIRREQLLAQGATVADNAFLATYESGLAATGGDLFQPLLSVAAPGALGDRRSLEGGQLPVDLNKTEGQLQTDCFDNAHPWCFVRELYLDMEFGDTQMRLGKQQIVWGKTDAFRLQDIVNPMDLGAHNVFPNLEDRRIPQLAFDLIHSFGDVGPVQDLSLEFVWVFDRFAPTQVGQCGEPYAFTAACEARADAGGHGLLNQSLAAVEERDWQLKNTEPGFRVEFRIPKPSLSLSFSAFWGFQDLPVARAKNHYSVSNPNPAMMMFLQGLGIPGSIIPAFDPYDTASIQASSDAAVGFWQFAFGPGGAFCPSELGGQAHALCITSTGLQPVGWMWSASEFILSYPRVLTLGGSLDYQIPGLDTVLRLEVAYEIDRKVTNTLEFDASDDTDVVLAAIGLDRSTFIPFLNRNRTAFLSFQTFIEHSLDHRGGSRLGMPFPETSVITTLFMQNYWRNDSIVLTNFAAFDWRSDAWITGPKLQWIVNEHLSFEVGANLLFGSRATHGIRDICSGGGLACLGDPTSWQPGNWQIIYENFRNRAGSPFFNEQSFADLIVEDRDEIWFSATYQF